MKRDYELLKSVLSVPSKTYQEEQMVKFITNWLSENNIPFFVDSIFNIYATKQTDENIEYFPCVVAHTDTVHNIDSINIREGFLPNDQNEMKPSLKAYNDQGNPTGIGGDDKCGIYACLELLKELPNLKAGFFVSEETGCHGSKRADKTFFENVGYAIQFDAPGNWMVSEYCMGVQLFDRDTEFFDSCDKVLTEGFNQRQKYQSHPYTDVYALKQLFDFSCINFAIGYYNYHTPNEYVIIEDVYSGIEIGKKMIEKLGYVKHSFTPRPKNRYTLFD
jgi:putative aminopeptidase FrvX